MTLSREEQRLLEEMEAALAAEDPALEANLRTTRRRPIGRSRAVWTGVLFLVGLTMLVAGVSIAVALSVVGFAVMLGATLAGGSSWPRVHLRWFQQPPLGD